MEILKRVAAARANATAYENVHDHSINFSIGRDFKDAYPKNRTAADFDEFERIVLKGPHSPKKGMKYIAAAFSDGHRCKESTLPRAFLSFDFDGIADGETQVALYLFLSQWRGFGYSTASHTPEKPRCRAILESSRPMDRTECQRVSTAIQASIEAHLGAGAVAFDASVYRPEQPCFTPTVGSEITRWTDGDPVPVDELLAESPDIELDRPGKRERLAGIASADPVLRALNDRGMVQKDMGNGRYAVECPCSSNHTGESSETSTVYMLPNFGGVKYGRFHCMHSHCRDRDNNEFLAALGLDPSSVYREQRAENGSESPHEPSAEIPTRVEIVCAADVPMRPISWVWPGWFAGGKLHIVAGAPGAGKSSVAFALAATITSGGRFPDGTTATPGNVLIWSGEDDPADTIIPRLVASGADLRRCHIIKGVTDDGGRRPFDPARDISRLHDAARSISGGVALLIVDPVVSAVMGDSHKNAEVRRSLQPLVDLASDLGAAVLGVTHHTKGTQGRDPVERVTGSIAFGALARIVFAVARMPEDQGGGRVFCRSKSNIGEDSGGFEYDLQLVEVAEGVECTAVRWAGPIEGTAREILAKAEAPEIDEDKKSALQEAEEFLTDRLEHGPVTKRDIVKEAKDEGIAYETLKRAKKSLGVQSEKHGFGKDAVTYWTFPAGHFSHTGSKTNIQVHKKPCTSLRNVEPVWEEADPTTPFPRRPDDIAEAVL